MKIVYHLILIGIINTTGYSQSSTCICFDEQTNYIKHKSNADISRTSFSIAKLGCETEQQRSKAIDEYRKSSSYDFPPEFDVNYFSAKKPLTTDSLKEADCLEILSVETFRKKDYDSRGFSNSSMVFLKELENGNFLMWNAMLMPSE
ncbi:MAG: hypothetical protein WD554_03480 [Flavobacteriaceae bacterium]